MSAVSLPGNGDIRLEGPTRERNFTVSGGISGISVQLEELAAGAEKLDGLAEGLLRAEEETGRILEELCRVDHQPAWSDVSHVATVRDSEWALRSVRTEMQRLGAEVRTCIQEYEHAEERASATRYFGYRGRQDLLHSACMIFASKAADGQTAEWLVTQLGARS